MGEPKPLASLTSGLLARKGGARPAMRRQPLGSGPANLGANGYDDLGWNDMGYDVDPEQGGDAQPRFDLKPLLTGSMPAHNVEAEQAVDAADAEPAAVSSLPWGDASTADVPPAKPEIVKQQEVLQARVEQDLPGVPELVPQPVSQPAPMPVAEPAPEPVRQQVTMTKPARRVAVAAPAKVRAGTASKARDKAAFTLRLDAERHLRLRLASAIYNRSAQHILIDVLDAYLSALPEIDAMASRLPTTPARRKSTHTHTGDDQ